MFAYASFENVYIYDSKTEHLILGPFEYEYSFMDKYIYFSPNRTHILVKCNNSGIICDIKRGEKQFRIKGKDFVFI